jgi:RNA polymerase sigma-70 factor (ECF subfamily)
MALPLRDSSIVAQSASMDPERELVARIRAGDVAAFRELYDELAPGLLRFALTQLHSRELAEELVQDLFLNVWKYRQGWVPTRSLKAYLFGALRNGISSYRRTRASRHELRQTTDDTSMALDALPCALRADDRLNEADLMDALDRAVDALPRRCRETFLLVRQQQLSYLEAADVLGVSVKAVEMNMVRAFAALRQQLADWNVTRRGGAQNTRRD